MIEKNKKSLKYYLWFGFVHYFFMIKINEVLRSIMPSHPYICDGITGILLFIAGCIDYGRDDDAETRAQKYYLMGLEKSK